MKRALQKIGLLAAGVLTVGVPPVFAVDHDGDGISDVWEQRYLSLDATNAGVDSDGDGATNEEEGVAGTNPFEPASRLRVTTVDREGDAVSIRVATQAGKRYQLLRNPGLSAENWAADGAAVTAAGPSEEFLPMRGEGAEGFFKVAATDIDSDGDGVSDWEERQISGFDPENPQSAVAGQSDLVTLVQRLGADGDAVEIEAITPDVFESTGAPAMIRITRAGTLRSVVMPLSRGGNPRAEGGSASSDDYELVSAAGEPVGGTVTIPFGASSVDLYVRAKVDARREVPEVLTLSLGAGSAFVVGAKASATITMRDAPNNVANEQLLVAYLVPAPGVSTSASGIATVRVSGDNSVASVDLSFSGLSSTQSAAHINAPGSGGDIKGFPRGQIEGAAWTLAAAQFLATDQAVVDALFAGQLTMNVLTGNYPDGEIRGNFVLSNGSANPPIPPAPPPVETLSGEALRRDVARFLMQATFGPTQEEIDVLAADVGENGGDRLAAYSAWIDAQFAVDQTSLETYTRAADAQEWSLRGTTPLSYNATTGEPAEGNRRRGWWTIAVKAHDALRQRVGFALSEIFVVSEYDGTVRGKHYGAANYYDMLVGHADGNYRDLLGEVSRHPIMGQYLSSLKNQKAVVDGTGKVIVSPDENYAREVMQLFSVGLVQLNADGSVKLNAAGSPVPTYTNTDITEVARVFTGWSFSKTQGAKADGYPMVDNANFFAGSGPQYFEDAWTHPMKNFAAYHDTGPKVVLGTALPAGQTGRQDMDATLDILANHANTGPFVVRELIQRLVTSNPSAGYVYRVAQVFANDGTGRRGNLGAVVKAILLDYEARTAGVAGEIGHGKQKEPVIRYVQLLRAFHGASRLPLSELSSFGYPAAQLDNFPPGTTVYRYTQVDDQLGQTPLRSPTVFNWFLPNYSPGGAISAAGLVAPEMQLTTETQVVAAVNYGRQFLDVDTGQNVGGLVGATDSSADDVRVDRSPFATRYRALIAAGRPASEALATVFDEADLLLTGGRLTERYAVAPTPNPRSLILDAALRTTETATSDDRVKALLYLLTTSPEFLHQP